MKTFFSKRTLLVVTGASRGLGLEITEALSSKVAPGSTVILMARNSNLLDKNCKDLQTKFPEIMFQSFVSNNEDASYSHYANLFDKHLQSTHEAVVVVHNAGSLGNIDSPLKEQVDGKAIDKHFQVNVRHTMLLSSAAIAKTKGALFMINISSLCGVKPTRGIGLYCTSKAARKMYFSCLAEENPNIRILQYSPGPLQTDMMTELVNCAQDTVSEMAKGFKDSGILLTVKQTTLKLCEILERNDFKSGDHVDYYDR